MLRVKVDVSIEIWSGVGIEIWSHVSYAGTAFSQSLRCGQQAGFGMMRDVTVTMVINMTSVGAAGTNWVMR